ncbi:hypothetical protein OUZ56_007769 [Daphnia magna]|uniref:Uncharacterized protein n=1 Tax=Daphnia magna TaxID=35525 RepID=A0ABR0AAZ0_9CRUS|nr:hypothetical protein OUZ56_007769 [Daphnia magna]
MNVSSQPKERKFSSARVGNRLPKNRFIMPCYIAAQSFLQKTGKTQRQDRRLLFLLRHHETLSLIPVSPNHNNYCKNPTPIRVGHHLEIENYF